MNTQGTNSHKKGLKHDIENSVIAFHLTYTVKTSGTRRYLFESTTPANEPVIV
jgi:hypothetical protein